MESADNGAGLVDCSPGTLVWVRRRNGSWWPGKILGTEELSSSHLMSPRSGTPVKLLGREDASVDWYNLEKSKRVKAFRCGEFDDCIERVESSMGMPPRKREKYARREDAVLHALELEKQLLKKGVGISGHPSNGTKGKLSDPLEKESVVASERLLHGNGTQSKSSSTILDSSSEDKSMDQTLRAHKFEKRSVLTVTTDKDTSEAVMRFRGLQDFGLGKARPLKRKHSSLTTMNGPENSNEVFREESFLGTHIHSPIAQIPQSSPKLSVDHPFQLENNNVQSLVSGVEQNGVKHFVRRKKSAGLPGLEASYDKQLSPNQLAVSPSPSEERHYPYPHVVGEENTSTSSEDTETDSSRTNSLELEVDGEMMALSDVAAVNEFESKYMGGDYEDPLQHVSMSKEEPDDSSHSSDMSHDLVPPGVSKWNVKGKRNIRGLSNRSLALRNSQGLTCERNVDEAEQNGLEESDIPLTNDMDCEGYLVNSKASYEGLEDNGISQNMVSWEDLAWNDHQARKRSWVAPSIYLDAVRAGRQTFGGRVKSLLFDVDVKVQSGYQRERVPMISLMSKFNGQAIIGHPILVEALANGSSEMLLPEADGRCPEALEDDKALTPTWRTARRTANRRIPRPHPSTRVMANEEPAEHFEYADQDKKLPFRKPKTEQPVSNKSANGSRPSSSSRKPQKKMSLSSNQKIKSLSSLGSEQKLGNVSNHETKNFAPGGLIKGESGPTVVACIPVKLVFSRLYEETIGRRQ